MKKLNNKHLLFRGQPKEFYEKPLTPSALREPNIEFMEGELKQFGIETDEYRTRCNIVKIPAEYIGCNKNAFYAYWLSLVNCAIAVNMNRHFYSFCIAPFFTYNKVGIFRTLPLDVGELCFNYAKGFFDCKNENEVLHIQYILHDYAFFQHLNHVFAKLDGSGKYKSLFPTLSMDWTWDRNQAEDFAGADGNILSIDFDAYKEWAPFKNSTVFMPVKNSDINGTLSKSLVFGFESYRDTVTWNDEKFDWDSWDNNLMIEQKGAVIFWPWTFTIDQMKNNELGKALCFHVLR